MHPTEGEPDGSRITDSPWFWGLLFATTAFIGSGLIAGKFDRRQRQIEGRFLGRQEAARERSRRAAGLPPVDLAAEALEREVVAPDRIVPLWTLTTSAALAALGCGGMLTRDVVRRRQPSTVRRRET